MRKLATIQKIVSIKEIPNAQNILCATVLGWECVVRKDENYKVGDLVVYIEIDSIVPKDNPYFAFMEDRKYKVKTIKLKKQVSQGLICPTSIVTKGKIKEGLDVTEILNITKYDPELEKEMRMNQINSNKVDKFFRRYVWYRKLFSKPYRGFPKFIKKTDETRIQNIPWIVEKEKDTLFYGTEKLDGQSATYAIVKEPKKWWKLNKEEKYKFIVCSRNINLTKPNDSSYWTIAKKLNIEERLKILSDSTLKDLLNIETVETIVLQGEIIGPGIQDNKYNLKEYQFYAFNLIVNGIKVNHKAMVHLLEKINIKPVQLIFTGPLFESVPECIDCLAKGPSTMCSIPKEGIVLRNYDKNISFKIINPDFLLKYHGGK